jgi:hypothetical protein
VVPEPPRDRRHVTAAHHGLGATKCGDAVSRHRAIDVAPHTRKPKVGLRVPAALGTGYHVIHCGELKIMDQKQAETNGRGQAAIRAIRPSAITSQELQLFASGWHLAIADPRIIAKIGCWAKGSTADTRGRWLHLYDNGLGVG